MVKYFINENKRQVIGLLEGTEWDAMNKLEKMVRDTDFCLVPNAKYMMPSKFKAVVTCDPRDQFDVEVGKRIAKQRVLKNYYKALDKRINRFLEAAMVLNGKVFTTPEDFENVL